MVALFVLVPKIWTNNKRDNNKLGRVQVILKEYPQEPRYFKQKETNHKGKHKIGCYPRALNSERLEIKKIDPNLLSNKHQYGIQ